MCCFVSEHACGLYAVYWLTNAKPEMHYCLEEEKQILGRGITFNRFDDTYLFYKKRLVKVFGKEGSIF